MSTVAMSMQLFGHGWFLSGVVQDGCVVGRDVGWGGVGCGAGCGWQGCGVGCGAGCGWQGCGTE